jgi:hypothetical protein
VPAPEPLRELVMAALTGEEPASPAQLCRASVSSLPVERAALLMTSERGGLELAAATDRLAATIADAELTTGEGPSPQALAQRAPVLVGDLAVVPPTRWPAFAGALGPLLVGGIFSVPLQLGAIRLGVLELHRARVGALVEPDLGAALTVAEAVATVLLLTGGAQDPDTLGEVWPEDAGSSQVVHQATGMVIAQLDVSADEAYVRLRAHAFAHDVTLAEVARAVVERTLRFDEPFTTTTNGSTR